MKDGVVNISVGDNGDLKFAQNNKIHVITERGSNSPIEMGNQLWQFYFPIKDLVLKYKTLNINMDKFVGLGKVQQNTLCDRLLLNTRLVSFVETLVLCAIAKSETDTKLLFINKQSHYKETFAKL